MTESARKFKADSSLELWKQVPFKAKAAVLVILYETESGDLNVVLTTRSSNLRSYPSQAAFPGGRCDHEEETAWETALREASEEIGFDPHKFQFEQLCNLPCYLSRNLLVVMPCLCLIKSCDGSPITLEDVSPSISEQEVDVVFSFPLKAVLAHDGPYFVSYTEGDWLNHVYGFYQLDIPNNDSSYWVAADNNKVSGESISSAPVVGLTAHMLVDCARIAYPLVKFINEGTEYGFEAAIYDMLRDGKFNSTRM
jgi:8-oxo-dGTP pyrophosphatase MutT (NUDIX family)